MLATPVYHHAGKAVDVVRHSSVLVSMHNQGVTGPTWNIYADMYADVPQRCVYNILDITGQLHFTSSLHWCSVTSPTFRCLVTGIRNIVFLLHSSVNTDHMNLSYIQPESL